MAREPTFQLGPQHKYPWLIGMWRLLAQKGGSSPPPGASPGPRRSLTLAVTLEAAQGYPPLLPASPLPLPLHTSMDAATTASAASTLLSSLLAVFSLPFCSVSCQLCGLTLHLEALG